MEIVSWYKFHVLGDTSKSSSDKATETLKRGVNLKFKVNGENWRVVQKIVPQAISDMPEEEEEEHEEDGPYQEDEPYAFGNRIEVDDQPIMMNRDDMDTVRVDVLNDHIGVEEEEDDRDAFINDDDDRIVVQTSDDELPDEDDMSFYDDREDE
ncbi:hypothetical protein RHMOL_Rhmol03G0242000 [Rhododendron molle]|uniref:Uncharacterized protein n=1 Tax=Rhododendron molle TaxID=49168 RepID=A0ACC0PJK4_RHOML|nr:hypothetical protein RHMOL_Rhmol03G0242000 [Rhododendron molle]